MDEAVLQDALLGRDDSTATLRVDFFTSLDGNGSAHGWTGYWGKEGPELRNYSATYNNFQ